MKQLEDRAVAVVTAVDRGPVERSRSRHEKPGVRFHTVAVSPERVKQGLGPNTVDLAQFKHGARIIGAAAIGCPIQAAGFVHDEIALRLRAVARPAESPNRGTDPLSSLFGQRVYVSAVIGIAIGSRAIQNSVRIPDHPSVGHGAVAVVEGEKRRLLPESALIPQFEDLAVRRYLCVTETAS